MSLELCAPIIIEEEAGLARAAEPVRIGVPLPRAALFDAREAAILDESDRSLRCQAHPLAHWPDRSIKWLLLDVLIDAAPHQRLTLRLQSARARLAAPHAGSELPLRIEERAEALRIDTGVAIFQIGGRPGILLDRVQRHGVELLSDSGAWLRLRGCSGREYVAVAERSAIEEAGPLRGAVRIEGHFRDGKRKLPLAFKTRLICHAGSAQLRLEVQVHNPQLAAHPGGLWDLDDRGTLLFEDLSLSLTPAGAAQALRWYAERPEGARADNADDWLLYQDSSGGESWDSDNHMDGKGRSTVTFRGYRVSCRDGAGQTLIAEGDRATPCVQVATGCGAIGATVLGFWQNFPKSLRWGDGFLSVGLFPGECRAPFALQGGEQKRHTLLEFLLPQEASSIPALQRPLAVHVHPDWIERSGAIPSLVAASRDRNQEYLRYVDTLIEGSHALERMREQIDEYGWRHFGDLYADHEGVTHPGPRALVSHYNNQYDFIYGALVDSLRSGDTRWRNLAEDAARHTIDIDIYHTELDKAAFNHGLFWHTDHHKPAATCTHRTYSRCNGRSPLYGGGPSNEHNYSSGLLLYFYLSGDPEAAAAVRGLGEWVIAMDDGARSILGLIDPSPTGLASKTVDPAYHKAGRGAGNSINALLDAYVLCGEQRYLDKAEELIRRCIHPADDIEALRLSEPELRWSYVVFLQALGKYLQLKREWNSIDYMFHYGRASLLHYGRWMAAHEVPYKEVLSRVALPTETWPAHDMRKCQVLHLTAELAPAAERAALHERARVFFERSVADVLSFDTAYLTRPRVILCVCGYTHAHFQAHPQAGVDIETPTLAFGQLEPFIPQRQRWRAALPRKLHLLVALLARVSIERLAFLGRRGSPLRT